MPANSALMNISCEDILLKTKLTCYADMIAYDQDFVLAAIRFGGYPEAVQALSRAISCGNSITVSHNGKNQIKLYSKGENRYNSHISAGSVYAESTLFLKDDELQVFKNETDQDNKEQTRDLYLFSHDDDELFAELDHKLSAPLIPEFKYYVITELQKRNLLNPLRICCTSRKFEGWHLQISHDENEIAAVLEDGLKSGKIRVPGSADRNSNPLAQINRFMEYMQIFGEQVTKKIDRAFHPLFDPKKEEICSALKQTNRFIAEQAGYELFDAQLAAAEALKRQLDHDKLALLVAECGSGKSKIGAAALHAYQNGKNALTF